VTTELADTVVLSAGAIHSPAILQRSGVGPAGQLRGLGIDVRADLPVGRGLQDHPIAMIQLPLTAESAIRTPDDRHTNVCVRLSSGGGAPENDLMFVSMNQSVLAMAFANTGAGAGAYGVWLNHNYSRGEVGVVSADPAAQPMVHQRMLSDDRDLPRLRHGLRALAELARSAETAPILGGPLEHENEALFSVLDDDAKLDDHLLATVGDSQHATSTCRMGAPDHPDTVVDPACRVLGVEGLRVVDASIFPGVPRANTNLAAIMVGELMADRLD
jgi:choline dehydrogenase